MLLHLPAFGIATLGDEASRGECKYIRPVPAFLLTSQHLSSLIPSRHPLIKMAPGVERSSTTRQSSSHLRRKATHPALLTSILKTTGPAKISKPKGLRRKELHHIQYDTAKMNRCAMGRRGGDQTHHLRQRTSGSGVRSAAKQQSCQVGATTPVRLDGGNGTLHYLLERLLKGMATPSACSLSRIVDVYVPLYLHLGVS